MNMYTCPK